MIGPVGPRWYVAQTQPHAETKAAAHLARQGFGVYLPRYLKRRRHARRIETVPAPLFPRYMFVSFDIAVHRWRAVRSTVGISSLICHGDRPVAAADAIVDGLKGREDEKGFVKLDQRPRLAPGDKIRVIEGVFSACLGLFEGLSDGERVAILLDLLGRKVRVVLDMDLVAAA
jgi:transcriptional antiterminator RfaH